MAPTRSPRRARNRPGRADVTLGDWTLTVTGEIVRIDGENTDKSGRNPRWVRSFVLRADGPGSIDAPAGATLPAELAIRVADRDLARLTDSPPAVGDRVEMRGRASGPRPATFYLTSVRRLPAV